MLFSAPKVKKVEEVETMVNKPDTGIRISYKTKETNNYKIDIGYQIRPVGASTRAIVEYLNKKDNTKRYLTPISLKLSELKAL